MFATILVQIPLAMLSVLEIPDATRDCRLEVLTPETLEERTLREFDSAVHAYAELRDRLARQVLATTIVDGEGGTFADELRGAIIAGHPVARRGEFFTPSVTDTIKTRLTHALLGGAGAMPHRLYEPLAGELAPEVNSTFPVVPGPVEWPMLFVQLPRLPSGLGYALWGRDLVLVDLPALLVLDVLPEALPEGARPGVVYP